MAYYTAQGWKGTNLSLTDFRHSGNNPYTAEEFALPLRRTDFDSGMQKITRDFED